MERLGTKQERSRIPRGLLWQESSAPLQYTYTHRERSLQRIDSHTDPGASMDVSRREIARALFIYLITFKRGFA